MAKDREKFVCEQIAPAAGSGDTSAMARGEPGLPASFTWRGTEYRISGVIEKWKTSSPCRSGAAEMYLRRHWYRVVTEPRAVMTIYFDRQAKDRSRPKARWFLYSIAPGDEGATP